MKIQKIIALISLIFLGGCDLIAHRLANVGRVPELHKVDTYDGILQKEEYIRKLAEERQYMEANKTSVKPQKNPNNSLWKPGSRAFIRDRRANGVGDILKVTVSIQDQARLDNKTTKTRTSQESAGVPNLMGFETKFAEVLPNAVNPSKLYSVKSNNNNVGEGKVNRHETINTTVAATVIKILPNNNLLIKGSQQVRVNFEVREVTVEGIVRPEDISSDNAVSLDHIAEARVSYGGYGQLSEYQQEKYGIQVLDIISPF